MMGLLCLIYIFWLSFIWVTCSSLQIWETMSFLFVSETVSPTRRVTRSPGLLGVGYFLGWDFHSSKTRWVLENQNASHSADHSGGLLTRSVPVFCHERPEHLLVSRFPPRWKEGGLMVRRGAQRNEDSFQGHMEWSKTSPGISQMFLVIPPQKMEQLGTYKKIAIGKRTRIYRAWFPGPCIWLDALSMSCDLILTGLEEDKIGPILFF